MIVPLNQIAKRNALTRRPPGMSSYTPFKPSAPSGSPFGGPAIPFNPANAVSPTGGQSGGRPPSGNSNPPLTTAQTTTTPAYSTGGGYGGDPRFDEGGRYYGYGGQGGYGPPPDVDQNYGDDYNYGNNPGRYAPGGDPRDPRNWRDYTPDVSPPPPPPSDTNPDPMGDPTLDPSGLGEKWANLRQQMFMPENSADVARMRDQLTGGIDALGNPYSGPMAGLIGQQIGRSGDIGSLREMLMGGTRDMLNRSPSQYDAIGTEDSAGANKLRQMLLGRAGEMLDPSDPEYQAINSDNPADTNRLRNRMSREALGLFDRPDRGELAREQMQFFNEDNAENLRNQTRDIGREAAAFGRIGSGVTTSKVGDAFVEAEKARARQEAMLANQTAGLELQDRMGALSGLSGVQNQLYGQDVGRRGEQRQERGYRDALSQYGDQRRMQGFGQVQNLQSMLSGQDFARRGEQRGERGYRDALSQYDDQRRAAALGQAQGLQGQLYGQEAGERAYANQLGQQDFARRGSIFDRRAGLQNQMFGQDAARRAERRQERGYADQLAQQDYERRRQQKLMEEQFRHNAWQRRHGDASLAGR